MMDLQGLKAEVVASLHRRGFLGNYSPVEEVDVMVIEQAMRWAGEVGEFCQRLAKDGGKDRQRLREEWADAMIVGLAIGSLLNLDADTILAKLKADEQRGYRHNGRDPISTCQQISENTIPH
ncbi:MAG: hypothetical protein J7M34_15020 [Anaerolineae bacterium]|nr:hypothetical protein [Anaerolineae bacterium]